jgi:tetratricopeptide (TPR) repeat protein
MSKYNIDLDYVILDIDISREELKEIIVEADKIISENKESNENLAMAYLKKAQCIRKLNSSHHFGLIFYDEVGSRLAFEKIKMSNKKLLEKVLELLPDMPEALMQLGLLNNPGWLSDKYDKAIKFFNKAIQLKPDYAATFNNRAMLFFESENICRILSISNDQKDKERLEEAKIKVKINFKNAVADLTEAIKIRPFDAIYHLNRGIFHSRLEEHKEAAEDFSNAINYASDAIKDGLINEDILIYKLRGKEYSALKDYDKAIDDFSETLRLEPSYNEKYRLESDHDKTLLLRGKAYFLAGEKEKAIADLNEYKNRKHKKTENSIRLDINNLFSDTLVDICKEEALIDYFISEEDRKEAERLINWGLS